MSTIVSHSPLNISEIFIDRGLVPKDHHGAYMARRDVRALTKTSAV